MDRNRSLSQHGQEALPLTPEERSIVEPADRFVAAGNDCDAKTLSGMSPWVSILSREEVIGDLTESHGAEAEQVESPKCACGEPAGLLA